MNAPAYRWVCHKCGSSNEPHTETCASCGFAAVASAEQVDHSQPDYKPRQYDAIRAERANRIWLFFPEGIFAAGLVVIAPFWAIRLILAGHVGAAGALSVGVALTVYAFVWFMRRGHKYPAYFAMIAALALAFVIYSSTQ